MHVEKKTLRFDVTECKQVNKISGYITYRAMVILGFNILTGTCIMLITNRFNNNEIKEVSYLAYRAEISGNYI